MERTEGDILSVTIGYNYHVSHLYSILQLLELFSHALPHLILLTMLRCRQLFIHSFTHRIFIEGLGKPSWLRQAWFCPGGAYILDEKIHHLSHFTSELTETCRSYKSQISHVVSARDGIEPRPMDIYPGSPLASPGCFSKDTGSLHLTQRLCFRSWVLGIQDTFSHRNYVINGYYVTRPFNKSPVNPFNP